MNEHVLPDRTSVSDTPEHADTKHSSAPGEPCVGCGTWERRQFVQGAVGSVAALLGLSLLGSSEGAAQIFPPDGPPDGARGMTTYAVPTADGVNIDTHNDVIIARAANKAYAFALPCPHQNTALRWDAKDKRFECPKHHSKFTPSGEFIEGRAKRNMDRLAIKLEANMLVVDTAREIQSDQDAAKWAAAFVQLTA